MREPVGFVSLLVVRAVGRRALLARNSLRLFSYHQWAFEIYRTEMAVLLDV